MEPNTSPDARAVACFTFDNLGEAAEIGEGRSSEASGDALHPSLAVGLPNLLGLLDRLAIRATFFVEGWNGDAHPDAVRGLVARGHELGMHGFLHERWSELTPEREAELAARATDALERAAGVRPRGFRAPGGARTPRTVEWLERLGYRYDASLGDGMRASRLTPRVAQLPFVWPGVDGFHYLRAQPALPGAVRASWLATLDRIASRGGLFVLVCHAFVTGVDPERLAALEAVMRAARADPRVRVATAGEAAEAVLA